MILFPCMAEGRFPWARAKHFLWLVAEEEVRQMCSGQSERKRMSTLWTTDGGHYGKELWAVAECGPWPIAGWKMRMSVLPLQGDEFFLRVSLEVDAEPRQEPQPWQSLNFRLVRRVPSCTMMDSEPKKHELINEYCLKPLKFCWFFFCAAMKS